MVLVSVSTNVYSLESYNVFNSHLSVQYLQYRKNTIKF